MNNSPNNLRERWKQQDGAGVLWVSFETFFIQRLNLCDITFIWKRGEEFDERLQILAIGVQSIFESSLRNLHARLSTPVALFDLNSFNIFKIDTELNFSNLSFFHGS